MDSMKECPIGEWMSGMHLKGMSQGGLLQKGGPWGIDAQFCRQKLMTCLTKQCLAGCLGCL